MNTSAGLYVYAHAYAQACAQPYICLSTRLYTHAYTHAYACLYTQVYTHLYLHIPIRKCIHLSAHASMHMSMHTDDKPIYALRSQQCARDYKDVAYNRVHATVRLCPRSTRTQPQKKNLVSTIACTYGRAARTAARAACRIERCLCHWRTVLPNGLLSRGGVCVHVHAQGIASELTSTKMLPAFGILVISISVILVISISVILVMAAYQSRHYVSSDSIRHMGYEHIGYVGYKSISVMLVPKAFGSVFSKLARTTYQFR